MEGVMRRGRCDASRGKRHVSRGKRHVSRGSRANHASRGTKGVPILLTSLRGEPIGACRLDGRRRTTLRSVTGVPADP